MKRLVILVTLFSLLNGVALAQDAKTNSPIRIPASQAKDHIGAQAIVVGKVAEVNIAERLIRVNIDKPFPSQPFTAVIFAAKTNLFPDIAKLKGKSVEVSGQITAYRERPQIVLTTTNQLAVVEKSDEKK
jgi:DNA/RNA endonuclease YhcR with UshA esterase domain